MSALARVALAGAEPGELNRERRGEPLLALAAMAGLPKQISLQSSIPLSVLLIGVLTGSLGLGYAYWHAKHTRSATIGLYFQELARHSAGKVGLVLAKEIEWVQRLSALPQVQQAVRQGTGLVLDAPELQQWREEQSQYFRSLAIIDRTGRLVGSATSETTRAYYAQQSWWPIVFQQGRAWAGDLRVDEQGHGYWEVAVPISDNSGSALGALKVAIRTDELFTSILHTRIGQTGHVMLLDEEGRVLVCPLLPPALHTKTDALLGTVRRAAQTGQGAVWAEVRGDSHSSRAGIVGVSRVALPSPIEQERVWHILVRQDPQEIYGPAISLMWKLAGFWLGAIGLVALFGAKLAQHIVLPLEALVERVRAIGESSPDRARGRRPHGLGVKIREIEALAASFDRLTERLQAASLETRQYVGQLERANRDLADSEEHYRTIWNHAMDAKLIVDVSGTIKTVNRRAEMKLGQQADAVIGTAAADLFVDQDRPSFRQLLQSVVATGKERTAGRMRVPTAAGATLTVELDMVPIEKTAGETEILLQLSDVTEKQQLADQLLRSERLASLSQFASMFAHDIRNPLAGIKKTLELLAHRSELREGPVGRFLEDLQFTTDLLLGMINDMLDVYQESYSGLPLVASRFRAHDLLQKVAHLFKSEADARGVSIRLQPPDEPVTITGDQRRLQRVGINLVHNALKYSPPHGVITLSTRLTDGTELPDGKAPSSGPFLLLRVEDEGPGLDPAELPHLFEMFFRKKDGHDLRIGRGLGLHFCRLVVEAHGGRIWARNRPTGGAEFSVALPLAGEERCRSDS